MNEEHTDFYAVISSNKVKVFEQLLNHYEKLNLAELEENIAESYNKALLNNIKLNSEMSLLVRGKLLHLRLFNEEPIQLGIPVVSMDSIKLIVNQVLESIDLLKSYTEKAYSSFLYIILTIAKCVRILKRLLRSTYDRIPWEEIEFCLVTYVASNKGLLKESDFYKFILTKEHIFEHLKAFANCINTEKELIFKENVNYLNKSIHSKFAREDVVTVITQKFPEFKLLYRDYSLTIDFFSLTKIDCNINFILNTVLDDTEGHLVMCRALQVIGECMKTSFDSPNLSSATCKRLLSSLPKDTRDIIKTLRDSISHCKALGKRLGIEKKSERHSYGIQKDLHKVSAVVYDVLCEIKIQCIALVFCQLIQCETIEEIDGTFPSLEFKFLNTDGALKYSSNDSLESLDKLIGNFKSKVIKKTSVEKQRFKDMKESVASERRRLGNANAHIINADYMLQNISTSVNYSKDISLIKLKVRKALNNLSFPQLKSNLNVISSLALEALDSAEPRLPQNLLNDVRNLVWKIFYAVEIDSKNVKCMEELRDDVRKKKPSECLTRELQEQLQSRLNLLEKVKSQHLSEELVESFQNIKDSMRLQKLFEIILLDIMSILADARKLTGNPHLTVNNSLSLFGKGLRNFLAHGDHLIDAMSIDACMDVLLNINILNKEYSLDKTRKIGRETPSNPLKINIPCENDLSALNLQEKLFEALTAGNLERIITILGEGADINSRSNRYETSLHFASMGNNLEAVKFVLNVGIDPSAKDICGRTPLHVAAAFGRTDIAEYFLEHKLVSVNEIDNKFYTPLHLAAQAGHSDVIKVILAHKDDFHEQDKNGFSPLHQALINSQNEAAMLLLEKEDNIELSESLIDLTPLHIASEKGNMKLVCKLLNKNAQVNAKTDRFYTPLHAAAKAGNPEVIDTLINAGADVNAKCRCGFTPLFYAAMYGDKTVINQLIQKGACVDVVDNFDISSPLIMAIEYNNVHTVEQLLQEGARNDCPNYFGMIPLHFATALGNSAITKILIKDSTINKLDCNKLSALHFSAMNGHLETVKLLVNEGANFNAVDINGRSPLHLAAEKGFEATALYLLLKGASVNLEDVTSMTALHLSVLNQHKEVSSHLISHNADIYAKGLMGITPFQIALGSGSKNMVDIFFSAGASMESDIFQDFTPLHLAVLRGDQEIVEYIIENGQHNPYRASTLGFTPLHLAVEGNHRELVKFLVEKGLDVNAKDKNGHTPVHYAAKRNYKEIVTDLVSSGVTFNCDGNGEPLTTAVLSGFDDIVDTLLQNISFDINIAVNNSNETLLHLAARSGYKRIVELLLSARTFSKLTCNVNARSKTGNTPLHLSAFEGHTKIVCMLLEKGASCTVQNSNNNSPTELAVGKGHLEILKLFIQHEHFVVLDIGKQNRTLLHYAAKEGKLDVAKYLILGGAIIDALDSFGYKPIHLAALHGRKDILEHFMNEKPEFKHELSNAGWNLLHFAVEGGHLNVAIYLIQQKIRVNQRAYTTETPLHISVQKNNVAMVKLLLDNGACYNAPDKKGRIPRDYCIPKSKKGSATFFKLFVTELMFAASKDGTFLEVQFALKHNAFVNATDTNGCTPLHYASLHGHTDIVIMLLEYGANPNFADLLSGCFPLHFASSKYHFEIAKVLLSNGAIFNPQNRLKKTPFNVRKNSCVADLLSSIDTVFEKVKCNNHEVLNDLTSSNISSIRECLRRTQDCEGNDLKSVGIKYGFSKNEELNERLMGNLEAQSRKLLQLAEECFYSEKYEKSLKSYKDVFNNRKDYWFFNDSDILVIKERICSILAEQFRLHEAYKLLQDVLIERKETSGIDSKDTLKTRMNIALVKHKQKRNLVALKDFQEIFDKQRTLLGAEHEDVLETQRYLALALSMVENCVEALKINSEVVKILKKKFGETHPKTLLTQYDKGTILSKQGKHEEAFEILQQTFDTQFREFGPQPSTLRTKRDMGVALYSQGKYGNALEYLRDVLTEQQHVLEEGHADILVTHNFIADVLCSQNKIFEALSIYKKNFERRKQCFGERHPDVLDTMQKMEHIECAMFLENNSIGMTVLKQHLINNNLSSSLIIHRSYSESSIYSTNSSENLSDDSNVNSVVSLMKQQLVEDSGTEFLMERLSLNPTPEINMLYNSTELREFGILSEDPMRRLLKFFNMLAKKHATLIGSESDYQIFSFIKLVNEVNAADRHNVN